MRNEELMRWRAFVKSEDVITLISTANVFKCRPSEIMAIDDPYTAYCLDSACAYIISKIEQGEEPQFRKEYKSFKDMYKRYA